MWIINYDDDDDDDDDEYALTFFKKYNFPTENPFKLLNHHEILRSKRCACALQYMVLFLLLLNFI